MYDRILGVLGSSLHGQQLGDHLADQRNGLDLDAPVQRQLGHLEARARRIVRREHCPVLVVDRRIVRHVGQVHGGLQHLVDARSGRQQDCLQVHKRLAHLGAGAAGDQLLGVLVQTEAAGQVDCAIGDQRLTARFVCVAISKRLQRVKCEYKYNL